MVVDKENELSTKQGPIIAAANSTEYFDAGAAKDLGIGALVRLWARVTTAFNNLTSLDFVVQGGNTVDAAGVPTFADAVTIMTVNTLLAGLGLNKSIPLPPLPQGKGTYRFYRFRYVPNGAAPTTGSISAGFLPEPSDKPANAAYTY